MLIHVPIKNKQDQVHIFQYIYLEHSQKHPKVIMYQFKHTNHNTGLYFCY